MSYKKKHVKQNIRRVKSSKPIFLYIGFWICLSAFLVFGGLAYFLFFSPYFQVRSVTVLGSEEEVRKAIEKETYGVINKNMLFFNTYALKNTILQHFPNIKEVSVKKEFPKNVAISVQERIPFAVYCTMKERCFWMDNQGFIFADFGNTEKGYFVVREHMSDAHSVSIGDTLLDKNTMSKIVKIEKSLREKFNIQAKEFSIEKGERMNVLVEEGWKIYVNIGKSSNIDLDMEKLSLLLNQEIKYEQRKKIEYIDLRFQDRAYYK